MKKDNLEDASFKLYSVITKRSITNQINQAILNNDVASLFPEYQEASEQQSKRISSLQGWIALILSVMITISVAAVYLPNMLKSFSSTTSFLVTLLLALPIYGFSLYIAFSSKKVEERMPTLQKIAAVLSCTGLGLITGGFILSLIMS